jgi:hypothetical protein
MCWKSSKKCQNPENLMTLAFFGFSKFHSQVPSKYKQNVSTLFPSVAVRICMRAPGWQKGWHFSRSVRILTGKLCKSEKMPESWGSQESGTFFGFAKFHFQVPLQALCKFFPSVAVQICASVPNSAKVAALFVACKCTYLRIFAKLKKCQNPEYLRGLTIFLDFWNFTLSTFTGHAKCFD